MPYEHGTDLLGNLLGHGVHSHLMRRVEFECYHRVCAQRWRHNIQDAIIDDVRAWEQPDLLWRAVRVELWRLENSCRKLDSKTGKEVADGLD